MDEKFDDAASFEIDVDAGDDMDDFEVSKWHYLPVYIEYDDGHREYSLCEVALDKDGKLLAWTKNYKMSPYGDDIDDLIGDLQDMYQDARKWKAVKFSSLKEGMVFEQVNGGVK